MFKILSKRNLNINDIKLLQNNDKNIKNNDYEDCFITCENENLTNNDLESDDAVFIEVLVNEQKYFIIHIMERIPYGMICNENYELINYIGEGDTSICFSCNKNDKINIKDILNWYDKTTCNLMNYTDDIWCSN